MCSLSVTAPAVTSGTDYFVTVTTPGGTSAYVPTLGGVNVDDFQYTTVTPVVTGISGPTSGSITGGGTITVSGSGFYNAANFAAQVWFWPVGGGSRAQGTNVVVSTSGSITANVPQVNSPGDYYIQVDTIGGNSVSTSTLYSYGVQYPIITGLSPSSGGTNTQLVISGGNFLANSSVQLFLNSGGNPSGTGITVSATFNTESSITVTIPSGLTRNAQYFPVVTLPALQPGIADLQRGRRHFHLHTVRAGLDVKGGLMGDRCAVSRRLGPEGLRNPGCEKRWPTFKNVVPKSRCDEKGHRRAGETDGGTGREIAAPTDIDLAARSVSTVSEAISCILRVVRVRRRR